MTKSRTFFIADDDPDDVELFLEAINKVDDSIKCNTAIDGEEALEKLRASELDLPDLIFLDLNMPRISGKQVLAELKNNNKLRTVPVIIYSTSALQYDIDETKNLGASYFLTKPSNFDELCRELSGIISSKPLAPGEG